MMQGAAATGGRRRGGGEAVDPTLIIDHDFTAMSSLPGVFTFTAVAGGTYYDSAGVQQTAATNQPRFDHHPATLVPLGLRFDAATLDTAVQSLSGTGYNGSAVTVVVDYMLPDGTNGNLGRLVSIDNATADGTDRSIALYTNSAIPQPNYNLVPQWRPAGTNQVVSGAVATNGAPIVLQRVGVAGASNDFGFAQNGTVYDTGTTTVGVPVNATFLRIGNLAAANRPFVGWVRRVRLHDVRKSNAALAATTALA